MTEHTTNLADHIPFINSNADCEIAKKLYADSIAFRISLENATKTCGQLPQGPKRWIDAGVDGLHRTALSASFESHISKFPGWEQIRNPAFLAKPDKSVIAEFVTAALDSCIAHSPCDWVSVPQLPIVDDASRNKVNKLFAECTRDWKIQRSFAGKLIVPAIFTNQRQLNKKTDRNKKVAAVVAALTGAAADGLWVVDSTLSDQDGSPTFERVRFRALVNLHEELNAALAGEDLITVGGPYWGMNLVLWARGLVRYAAIGLGNSYQYHIPGSVLTTASKRIALGPLRRWAIASPKLKAWLADAVKKLPAADPAASEFRTLEKDFGKLQAGGGRLQVATFYKQWFDKFSSLPNPGRALALYQDLSSAYVLGKALPDLPSEEKTSRSAARVAKQFMLNCL